MRTCKNCYVYAHSHVLWIVLSRSYLPNDLFNESFVATKFLLHFGTLELDVMINDVIGDY